jgi:Helix-turn-helix domain
VKDETRGVPTTGSDEYPPTSTKSESSSGHQRSKAGSGFVAFDREAARVIRAKLKSPVQRDILTELMLRVDHLTHDLAASFDQLAQYCRITRQRLSRNLPDMEEAGILEVHRGTNDDDVSVFAVLCYAELSPVTRNKTFQPLAHGGTDGRTRGGNKVVPLNIDRPAKTRPKKKEKEEEEALEQELYFWAASQGLPPNMGVEEIEELHVKEAEG